MAKTLDAAIDQFQKLLQNCEFKCDQKNAKYVGNNYTFY